MAVDELVLPLIDLSGYISPKSPEDKERVIAEVRDACRKFGFFQVKGHGVPLKAQEKLVDSLRTFFNQSKEEKMAYSFLKNAGRRGYESSGDSLRDGDALPDSKEAFYIGPEDQIPEPKSFRGPNLWPNLSEEEFRGPVWEYYEETKKLGHLIWEILLQGLGFPPTLLNNFTKRPVVINKMIRYPPQSSTLKGQFGVGSHTDFGGVTCLLQQPGREGLEVWIEESEKWISVPSIEDVYIINMGDMIASWSGGEYKSVKHRVINKGDVERISCATFWHGDLEARNPLNPEDPNQDTLKERLVKRFGSQFSLPKTVKV